MARELVTLNFHHEGQTALDYIDNVFPAAEFFKYEAKSNS